VKKKNLRAIIEANNLHVYIRCTRLDNIIRRYRDDISATLTPTCAEHCAAVETVDERKILRAISINEFSCRETQPLGSRKKNGRENEGGWDHVDKHRANMRCYWPCILSKKTILSDCCPHNQIQPEHDCEFFFNDIPDVL